MGWWLQAIGGILILIGTLLSVVGFFSSPQENVFKSLIKNFQIHFGSGDNVAGDKIVQERKLFTQTQYIKTLPPSLGGIDLLNLDNVAILKTHAPYNANGITMLLDVGVKQLTPIKNKDFTAEGISIYDHTSGEKFYFDLNKNKRHVLRVVERNFVVTLFEISELNVPSVGVSLQYKFGISEVE